MKFGAIGYGYWGPNVVRNLDGLEGARILAIADKSPAARERAQRAVHWRSCYAGCERGNLRRPISTLSPSLLPSGHTSSLPKAALENGKHVFVEKPFTSNTAQAEELINLAARKNLRIMVDHTFLFTGAVRKIKQLLDADALGKLYYYDSTRVNLGLFQHDVNVDLGPCSA